MDKSLAEFLDTNARAAPIDNSALYDVPRITAILQAAAHDGRWLSYSEILGILGFRFTRPKMRVLCNTMFTVDAQARACNEPELAVLVVRESDHLPGQGWWKGRTDYDGEWTGSEARKFIAALHQKAFRYWQERT